MPYGYLGHKVDTNMMKSTHNLNVKDKNYFQNIVADIIEEALTMN
jgi:hypothetical protein